MKKMITNLSKNVVKADPRFHLREDLNFTDDGNRFRGFDYKGLPITTLRADGITYCSIRVDYLDNEFTYKEWMETEEDDLCDEFNGVDQIDLEKLIENCERIIAKIEELNKKCREETLDMSPVLDRLTMEGNMAAAILEKAKTSVKWWKLDDYKLKSVRKAFEMLTRDLVYIRSTIKDINDGVITRKKARWHLENLHTLGYVKIKRKGYYWIETLNEFM